MLSLADKTILVDGKELRLRATAAVPRLYRMRFGRDLLKDMLRMREAFLEISGGGETLDEAQSRKFFEVADLEIFENVAYIFAKHADPQGVPDSPEDWLEQFEGLSIYRVLPEVLLLWLHNEQTTVESKKKLEAVAAN